MANNVREILRGQSALVTGANSGIGEGIARAMAAIKKGTFCSNSLRRLGFRGTGRNISVTLVTKISIFFAAMAIIC